MPCNGPGVRKSPRETSDGSFPIVHILLKNRKARHRSGKEAFCTETKACRSLNFPLLAEFLLRATFGVLLKLTMPKMPSDFCAFFTLWTKASVNISRMWGASLAKLGAERFSFQMFAFPLLSDSSHYDLDSHLVGLDLTDSRKCQQRSVSVHL